MKEKKNSRTLVIAGLGVIVLAAGAWGLTAVMSKHEPTETEVLVASAQDDPGKMMEQFREKMRDETMTDEARDKLRQSMREVWETRMNAAVDEYYTAKEEERQAILDKHIDEMEKWRKAREDRDREEEEKAAADGKSEEEREKEREKMRDEWRKRMNNRSKEERKTDSESRDPNQRARQMAYRSALHKQMKARGIEPPRWGGGGRGGPGGGPGRG